MPENPTGGPPVPPDYFERFVEELEGIRRAVEYTNKLIPQEAADAAKNLADFYTTGFSQQASRVIADPLATELKEIQKSLDSLIAQGKPSVSEGGPSPTASTAIDPQLREMLGMIARQSGTPGRYRGVDERENESGGYQRRSSPTADLTLRNLIPNMRNWQEQVTGAHLQQGVLEIPRSEGGHFTISDLFNYLGDLGLGKAAKRQQGLADTLRNDPTSLSEDIQSQLTDRLAQAQSEDERAAVPDDLAAELSQTSTLGKVGTAAATIGAVAPKAKLLGQYFRNVGVMGDHSALEAQGAALNVSPQSGDAGGAFGFRVPFLNPAARAAEDREWNIVKMRAAAGINGQQARQIFDLLNAHGFSPQADPYSKVGGSTFEKALGLGHLQNLSNDPNRTMQVRPTFGAMADSLKHITQKNPQLLNETTVELMDKATRNGAMSLGTFSKNMERVANVAKNTGYSFNQLEQDMMAVGNQYEQMGGTHAAGQQAAVEFQGLTKTPAAIMPQLMQNPFLQAYAVQKFGLMPWEQGLMSGSQWGQTATGGMQRMYNMFRPGLTGRTIDLGNGFKEKISPQRETEALMAQQLGIDPAQIHRMLRESSTVQARGTLEDRARAWSQQIGASRNDPKALQRLFGSGSGDWGAVQHQMTLAGFSAKEKQQVIDAGKASLYDSPFSKQHGDMMNYLHKHKGSTEAQYLATQRLNKIQDIINKKGDLNQTDQNKVTVELGPNAKKHGFGLFFQGNKAKANAGQTSVNVPFGTGPSPTPSGSPFGPTFDPSNPTG